MHCDDMLYYVMFCHAGVMFRHALLCCAIFCHDRVLLWCALLCDVVFCRICRGRAVMLCCAMSSYALSCSALASSVMICYVLSCSVMLVFCSVMLCCAMLCSVCSWWLCWSRARGGSPGILGDSRGPGGGYNSRSEGYTSRILVV